MSDKHTLIYVDDSGDDTIGVSMSALLIPAERWSQSLGYWKGLRADLEASDELPKNFEVHSNAFLSAQPLKDVKRAQKRHMDILESRSTDPAIDAIAIARAQLELADLALDRALSVAESAGKAMDAITAAARLNRPDVASRLQQSKTLKSLEALACFADTGKARRRRRQIYKQLLNQINAFPDAAVVTVCADDGSKGTMAAIYGRLLEVVNSLLEQEQRWGTMIVDGTPSARTLYYREAHRQLNLAQRRILEDEVLRGSGESHFIQMADIVAHSAFGWRRTTEDDRYMALKDVVRTADGQPFDEANPGFFRL